MTRLIRRLLLLAALAACSFAVSAAEEAHSSYYTRYSGTGVNASNVLFTTGDLSKFDACVLMATTGTVNVFVSLDGTNYSTSALSLEDHGATSLDPVLSASANRVYSFVGKYAFVKVLQVGATATSASLNCWKI